MSPYVPYALKIWFCSVLSGSTIFLLITTLIDGEGVNKLSDVSGLFILLIVFIGISLFRSILAFLILIYTIIAVEKFTKTKYTFNFILCIFSYLLCFATLYIFFLRNKPFPQNLTEPMLWEAFLSYSIGLSIGILYWGKKFKYYEKIPETEV